MQVVEGIPLCKHAILPIDYIYIVCIHTSLNRHLIVVEEFEHLNDPRSYVVRGLMPLLGSPKANRS